MPFHRLTALLCLGIVIVARLTAVAADCPTKCGGVEIPYPFGVGAPGSGCAMPGFELNCSDTGNGEKKPIYNNVELLSISLLQGQVRMNMNMPFFCHNSLSPTMDDGTKWSLNLVETPYRFSNTGNKFTVMGCQTLAYIIDRGKMRKLKIGCVATCEEGDLASLTDGTCSGIGCCQTAIPKGLQYYKVSFDQSFSYDFISRCSYAALVEASNFTFSSNRRPSMTLAGGLGHRKRDLRGSATEARVVRVRQQQQRVRGLAKRTRLHLQLHQRIPRQSLS